MPYVVNPSTGEMEYRVFGGSGGIGDVVGPASSTDNALVRWDGVTGKLIQNSTAIMDDSGNGSFNSLLLGGASSSSGGGNNLGVRRTSAATNTAFTIAAFEAASSGTTSAGFGAAINWILQNASGVMRSACFFETLWENATAGSESAYLNLVAKYNNVDKNLLVAHPNYLHMKQGQVVKRTNTAVNYSVLVDDFYIAVTSTAAPRTITLPSNAIVGQTFVVKDESGAASTNAITINVSGGVITIDGSLSTSINTNYGALNLIFNGTQYFIW